MGRFRREPRPRSPGYNPEAEAANGARGAKWCRDRAVMTMKQITEQAARWAWYWNRHRDARRERARLRRTDVSRRKSRDTVLGRRR